MGRSVALAACVAVLAAGVAPGGMEAPGAGGFDAGFESYYTKYDEPGVAGNRGVMYGVYGSYTGYAGLLMLRAETRVAWGGLDYRSPVSGTLDGVDNMAFEMRGLAGRQVPLAENAWFTPYLGVGYRFVNDDASGRDTSAGHFGYERRSNYLYSPVGVEAARRFENGWTVTAALEYDHFWRGRQDSLMGDVEPRYPNVSNRQEEGWGGRASLRFARRVRKLDIALEPFVRYWDVERSKSNSGFYEPANTTTEAGIRFGVIF